MIFKSLKHAQSYLYSFRSEGDYFAQGGAGFNFERVKQLAQIAGNPQNKLKVIHVAGTSGKGSVSTCISALLHSHGYKTGLSVSPHIFDIRERIQINNQNISESLFLNYLNEFNVYIRIIDTKIYGKLTFFEIMIVLAYYIFLKEKVHYAIMETGLGGRFDATNIANSKNKVAVLTKIGLDHTEILGTTLAKIASEKAGIIYPHNKIVAAYQNKSVLSVFTRYAKKNYIKTICFVKTGTNYSNIQLKNGSIYFDFIYKKIKMDQVKLAFGAKYQAENVSLAIAAFYEVSLRDRFKLNVIKIRSLLNKFTIVGRFQEVSYLDKKIVIDGAHNPQKMSVFMDSLKFRYPDQKFDFLVGFKKGKDYKNILNKIVPISSKIVISEFRCDDQALVIKPEKSNLIFKYLKNNFTSVKLAKYSSLQRALSQVTIAPKNIVVITGSLYMNSEILKLIFRKKGDIISS